jgi:KipI family sensor histidine kinase inhibitor
VNSPTRIHRVGADALLVEVDDPIAWYAALTGAGLDAIDIVPGAGTVLLDGVDLSLAEAALRTLAPPVGSGSADGPLVEVPIEYGGPDLSFVATAWGLDEEAAVQIVASTQFTVAFCGFSPGFAYMTGLPSSRALPRLPDPRPSVPAGSLGLAGPYAGIYPSASPGGWRLIGRTGVALFDVEASPPALLSPGARVRLVPC